MRTTILFVALLVASSYAVQSRPSEFLAMNKDNFDTMLEQIKGTPLGRSVSAMIRIKMKLGDADYSRMFEAFDQLRQFLLDQRQELSAVVSERTRRNTLVLDNEGTKMQESQTVMTEGATKMRTWENQLERKQNRVNTNENTITTSSATLEQAKQLRQDKIDAYNADRERIVQAIEGCRAAIECLNRLKVSQQQGTAFLQVAEEKTTLIEHYKTAIVNLGQVKGLRKQARMIKSLMEMTNTQEYTDQSTLTKVIDLIDQLKSDLWDKLAICDETEESDAAAFETTVTELTTLITGAEEENVTLRARIVVLQGKHDDMTETVATATGVNSAATSRFTAENEAFAAFMEEMNANNDRIDFELGILDQAEEILANDGIVRGEA